MKKILFVIESLTGGGAEGALVRLVNRLDPAEFSVTVLTVQPGSPGLLKPHIRCRCLNESGNGLGFLRLRLLAQLGLAYRLDIRGDYDLEIAFLEGFPTKLLAPSPGPKLAWVHCDMADKEDRRKMRRWYPTFDRVVCVSRDAERSFRRFFTGRTCVLPNVVDAGEILEKSRAFSGESFDFLAVGRLSREKGFDRLLDAFESLHTGTLGIIGDGPEGDTLRRRAKAMKNVTFLGQLSNPYPYMAAAKILVIPSRSEGRSTVALEGLILGKAIVASRCAGMAEILGSCGLITDDLAQGMARCLDGDFRRNLEAKARCRGAALSADGAVEQTQALLRQVLRERGK